MEIIKNSIWPPAMRKKINSIPHPKQTKQMSNESKSNPYSFNDVLNAQLQTQT